MRDCALTKYVETRKQTQPYTMQRRERAKAKSSCLGLIAVSPAYRNISHNGMIHDERRSSNQWGIQVFYGPE